MPDTAELITALRTEKGLSQEGLAEQVYVSRQTISNWETGKSYPDVQSLLILGDIFNVSLDDLIKGDVDTMKEAIKKDDGKELKKNWNLAGIIFLAALAFILMASLTKSREITGILSFIAGALFAFDAMTFFKMEQVKKDNDVQTYREVIAFMNGETLDDIEKAKELKKRGNDLKILAVFTICCIAMAALLAIVGHFVL